MTLKMIFEWQSHDRDCITSKSRARATGTKHGVHEYLRKNVRFALFARIYLFCFVSTYLVLFCYYDFFFLLKSNTTFGPYLHYTGEIRKRSSVHTKPVTKIGSFSKTLFTPKNLKTPTLSFRWTEHISKTEFFEYDGIVWFPCPRWLLRFQISPG